MPNPLALTGKQARYLRALCHHQSPVVQVGRAGVTEALLQEVEGALLAHELIKIRISGDAPTDATEAARELAGELQAGVAQVIGHTVALYRPHPTSPKINLPSAKRPDKA